MLLVASILCSIIFTFHFDSITSCLIACICCHIHYLHFTLILLHL
ncbi:hypothetical protein HMPREF3195_01077 [Peptostreptococcus anaerobius]|uniref:Uncharacterized protein n=1 Tax=Peptostreptococcus anaerobius TaxID=1261 RepID=A0A135YSI7_9FIRM|nr:hypothetical protein HMPREF3195_01077 [Peptostreptococcus anaerobius]